MKNSKEIFRNLLQQITLNEDQEEIKSILYLVVEYVLGLSRADIISEKSIHLSEQQSTGLTDIIRRINQHEPIQYIIGEAHFFGRNFRVTPAVLIPRPETELLIEEVLNETSSTSPGSILDIGTGSGCIAITLAKELPLKKIQAIDISKEALSVAQQNAIQLNAEVSFHRVDALHDVLPFKNLEMIVSNPPYVAAAEKTTMRDNVVNFEPHLALFVPDRDPLVFYAVIAQKGFSILGEHGKVIVEINERFGKETADVFRLNGFKNVRIVKDLQQKDRIVIAIK
jgi:release factor glutamine methyltransferase